MILSHFTGRIKDNQEGRFNQDLVSRGGGQDSRQAGRHPGIKGIYDGKNWKAGLDAALQQGAAVLGFFLWEQILAWTQHCYSCLSNSDGCCLS
jgi:hypothetical protein